MAVNGGRADASERKRLNELSAALHGGRDSSCRQAKPWIDACHSRPDRAPLSSEQNVKDVWTAGTEAVGGIDQVGVRCVLKELELRLARAAMAPPGHRAEHRERAALGNVMATGSDRPRCGGELRGRLVWSWAAILASPPHNDDEQERGEPRPRPPRPGEGGG